MVDFGFCVVAHSLANPQNNPESKIANLKSYDAYLLGLLQFGKRGADAIHPGLANIETLMDAMGRPHEAFESIHIAGTNGKGSTASLLAAIATASGRRVGLHTSPHLFHLRERLRLDGVPAPEAWIAEAVARYRAVFDAVKPSFFEAMIALSFLYFAEENVDLAVVEVGLGGRLDATNLLVPGLSLITNIALEHTHILGDTLEAIAREKAGIIKPGVPVLIAVEQPGVVEVIRAVAEARGAPFHRLQDAVSVSEVRSSMEGMMLWVRTPVRRYEALAVGLPGLHQQTNALLALRAAEMLFDDLRRDAAPIYEGLQAVRRLARLRGRLEVVQLQPLVVADVAHNLPSLKAALAFVQAHRPNDEGRLYVLLGAMRDKDTAGMARALAEAGALVWPLALDTERALPADELAALMRAHGATVVGGGPLEEGWHRFHRDATPDDVLLVTGSHQVVEHVPGLRTA